MIKRLINVLLGFFIIFVLPYFAGIASIIQIDNQNINDWSYWLVWGFGLIILGLVFIVTILGIAVIRYIIYGD